MTRLEFLSIHEWLPNSLIRSGRRTHYCTPVGILRQWNTYDMGKMHLHPNLTESIYVETVQNPLTHCGPGYAPSFGLETFNSSSPN